VQNTDGRRERSRGVRVNLKSTPWLMAALMCCAPIAGITARPDIKEQENFLEATVPPTFGEWTKLEEGAQIIDPATAEQLRKIYKEVLSRTYVNKAGYRIMLSMARSGNQIGIQQAHLPEICYPAQGFTVGKVEDGELITAYGPINVRRLTTSMRGRYEPVTYWLTMADHVVSTQWDKRMVQIGAFLTGQSPDGLMFRISSIDKDSEHAFAMQQKFAADMMESVPPEARRKLSGLTSPSPL
jgi:EpsI family protein